MPRLTEAMNFRSNVDMDITKTTVVNLGVQGNVTENMEPVEGSAAIYRDIINAAPNAFPVRFKDGELAGRDGLNNPYNMLTQRGWKKISLGIGDVTRPLCPAVIKAMHTTPTTP